MPPEIWFRNPSLYVRELVEVGAKNLTFDVGYLMKRNMDPMRVLKLYFPPWLEFRVLVIGNSAQGAAEIDRDTTLQRPRRIHPVWMYGEDFGDLEALAASAEDHYIILNNLPNVSHAPSRSFYRALNELQEEYPDAKLFLHGLYSFNQLFGRNLSYGDYDARTPAASGAIRLPNGKQIRHEDAVQVPHWINLLGFAPDDLRVPRNRCLFNIESALWARKHFNTSVRFMYRGKFLPDSVSKNPKPAVNNAIQTRRLPTVEGDKFHCDTCSLQLSCKLFRTGSVCIVPESEPVELARFFKTRDSDTIIEGLGTLLAAGTRRLEKAMQDEHDNDKIDPEVTKMINTLFDRGVKLAKLVDPKLAAAPTVRVSLTQNNAQIGAGTPQQLMAAVYAELEARGVKRENITPEMIEAMLQPSTEITSRAIEATRG